MTNQLLAELEMAKREIERLNEIIKGLREERDYLFNKTTTESNYEIERLNNIIKEVRERLIKPSKFIERTERLKLLEILDKGE